MEQEAEALLKHLGMTDYEARSYLSLIKHGKLTADKVSVLAEIPLPRVYDTMLSLSRRGLIFVSKTRPQIFEVTNTNRILEILKEDEKKKMEDRVKHIETIVPQFLKHVSAKKASRSEEDTEEILAYIKRRVNIGKIWEECHDQTKSEFLVFAGDLSWGDERLEKIKKMVKSGIKYRIVWCKQSKEVLKNARMLARSGAELRFNDSLKDLRAIIVDGKKLFVIQKTIRGGVESVEREGEKWSEKIAEYGGIMITNKTIIDVFRNYFFILWEKGTQLEKLSSK